MCNLTLSSLLACVKFHQLFSSFPKDLPIQTGEVSQTVDTHNGVQHLLRTDSGVTRSRGKEVASGRSNRKINSTVANSTFNGITVSHEVRGVGRRHQLLAGATTDQQVPRLVCRCHLVLASATTDQQVPPSTGRCHYKGLVPPSISRCHA